MNTGTAIVTKDNLKFFGDRTQIVLDRAKELGIRLDTQRRRRLGPKSTELVPVPADGCSSDLRRRVQNSPLLV